MSINIIKKGRGAPCVLLHGWGFDHTIWNSLVDRLDDGYQFYLVDLPGFGETPFMPGDKFHHELLDKLPDCFSLVGWSIGGLHATHIALEYPARVNRLLNITSSPQFFESNGWPGISTKLLSRFCRNLKTNSRQTIEHFILLQGIKINPETLYKSTQQGLEEGFNLLNSLSFKDSLEQIGCPTGYFFGRLDKIVPVSTYDLMKIDYPKFTYHLFQHSGHIPFMSQLDEFVAAFNQFFCRSK